MSVAGANVVGVECTRRLAERGLEVVLIDPEPGLARSRALDINRALAVAGVDGRASGADHFEAGAGSAVCVIAESPADVPGLEPEDAIRRCREVVSRAAGGLTKRSPDTVLIVISEPQEVGCHCALAISGFPRGRVVGIGAMQAVARVRLAIAEELGCSVADVQLCIVGVAGQGGHRLGPASIAGVPLTAHLEAGKLDELWQANVAPGARRLRDPEPLAAAAAASALVDAIFGDAGGLVSCSAFCRGEYGVDGAFVSVPCRLDGDGIAEIVELELPEDDLEALQAAGAAVRQQAKAAKRA